MGKSYTKRGQVLDQQRAQNEKQQVFDQELVSLDHEGALGKKQQLFN
jgi:hypothetical protein